MFKKNKINEKILYMYNAYDGDEAKCFDGLNIHVAL